MTETLRDPVADRETFRKQLAQGEYIEECAVRWLKARGSHARKAEGPVMTTCGPRQARRPDIVVMPKDGRMYWLESKFEATLSYHLRSEAFGFSIGRDKFKDYVDVSEYHGVPTFILLVVGSDTPPESDREQSKLLDLWLPETYPWGVFTADVKRLASRQRFEDTLAGDWAWFDIADFHYICDFDTFMEASREVD